MYSKLIFNCPHQALGYAQLNTPNMLNRHLRRSRIHWKCPPLLARSNLIDGLIESRNIFNVQTIDYDLVTVCSMDLDPTNNFLIVGLSNGAVDLQEVQDPTMGTLDQNFRFQFSQNNLHRVQWNPGEEQFFSILDNHNLLLIDPVEMRPVERFKFDELKTTWSEWNPNDSRMIAVCGSGSQVRLVDIGTGSSAQTIILGAQSGLASHRATRCLWSKCDSNCLIVGDNEGYLHVYDTRHLTRPRILVGEERGQISGMAFTNDQCSIITSQGTDNQLVQWAYDKCSLRAFPNKFRKRKKPEKDHPMEVEHLPGTEMARLTALNGPSGSSSTIVKSKNSKKISDKKSGHSTGRTGGHRVSLPVDAYLRCQFYVTDGHLYCPVPNRVKKSKELYIYNLASGERIKTLKSESILCHGVYSIVGLLPDSLVLYVGGRGRLRTWSLDEGYQQKMEEKMRRFHTTRWDSDDEL